MRLLSILICVLILPQSLIKEARAQIPSFADLTEKLTPGVVNISGFSNAQSEDDAAPSEALGSGFIIDSAGHIITNNHVIDKADSISVTLHDNTKLEADVIGTDPKTDLALIKINANRPLSPVTLGNSDKIRVGDWILAIGNPFGLGSSVTAGIISAKSRDIESGPYDSFIQTDAAINQGNSGGPMFNMSGEVIGISSAIFSTTGANQGIGFAIPVNLANWVISQLKQHGTVKRGWIGIKIQPNTPEISANLGINANQGVVVSGTSETSPARQAGLQAGDIILNFNNLPIDNTKNLSRLIAETPIGTKAPMEIWRNQQKMTLTIPIEEMLEETLPTPHQNADMPDTAPAAEELPSGILVNDITPETISQYALKPDTTGVIVTDVLPNSDAARKGIKLGDIIVKLDKRDIPNATAFNDYVSEARRENNRPVLLAIQGSDAIHFVAVKLMPHD